MSRIQIKVLQLVYDVTDCCNEVFDYAILHHTQSHIAELLVVSGHLISGQCLMCDGDGRHIDPERWRTGYRLTIAGYGSLTEDDPEKYPASLRRFATAPGRNRN